jgi:similar to stage IV sporulation protein
MGRPGVWEWIRGYVIIVVTGGSVGSFLSKCMDMGIEFADVSFVGPSAVTARVGVADYRRMVQAQRGSGCRVLAFRRGGAPFLLQAVWRRKTALVGAIAFFGTILALASFVWRIDVVGASDDIAARIVRLLEGSGVRPRMLRSAVDCDHIRNKLWAKVDGLAFVGVELRGVVLTVTVAEKEIPHVPKGPIDLVSSADALITQVIVLEGTSHVAEGDVVAKGDLLVSAPAQGGESAQARAIVRGRVWREFAADAPQSVQVRLRTGRIARRFVVAFGGREVNLGGQVGFEAYDVEEFRAGAGAIELRWLVVHELSTHTVHISREEAASMALAEARARAMEYVERIGDGAEVASVVERVVDLENGLIRAVVIVETVEGIAQPTSRRDRA